MRQLRCTTMLCLSGASPTQRAQQSGCSGPAAGRHGRVAFSCGTMILRGLGRRSSSRGRQSTNQVPAYERSPLSQGQWWSDRDVARPTRRITMAHATRSRHLKNFVHTPRAFWVMWGLAGSLSSTSPQHVSSSSSLALLGCHERSVHDSPLSVR